MFMYKRSFILIVWSIEIEASSMVADYSLNSVAYSEADALKQQLINDRVFAGTEQGFQLAPKR